MDLHEYTLLVGMANRLNYIYDIRKLDAPVQRRDSSLKFMTRCLKLTPNGDGIPPPFSFLSLSLLFCFLFFFCLPATPLIPLFGD